MEITEWYVMGEIRGYNSSGGEGKEKKRKEYVRDHDISAVPWPACSMD